MSQHDEHAVVRAALIADPACGLVVQAALELAGITTDLGPPAPMWEALASGRVARAVCVGPEASDHWIRAGRPAPDRVVWVPRGYDLEVPDMATILERLGSAGRGAPRERWAPDAAAVAPGELLGALLTLRPTMKVVVQRPVGALGLCLVRGRVIAAAVEGRRLATNADVRRDRSLALVMDAWGESTQALDARQALYADLAFTCDYDHLFGPSAGFAQHATGVLAELLAHPIEGLVFEPHAPSDQGPPLSEVALRALVALPDATRRHLLGDGPFQALGTIPKWLRGTLPPERFGRIFFVLAEGVHLRDLPRMRLTPAEVEAAVILGTMTGIARRPGPQVFAPLRKTPALGTVLGAALGNSERIPLGEALGYSEHTPATPMTPGTPSVRPRRVTGESPRVKTNTLPMGSPDMVVAVNPPVCGSSEGFFAMLRALASQGRGERRRARLAGTRLEPLGEVVGDLLVYYGIGASESTRAMLGVMARGEHAGRVLVAQRPARGGDSFDDRHGGGAEARLLNALAHPHIVKGLGDIETPAGHVLLTEHVHGVTLAELVATLQRRDEPLPDAVLVYIGVALARALQHVHDLRASDGRPLGLVHGDINPSNVLLGFGGDVKLMGFTHARYRSEAARSRRGPRIGRIGYMSPESLVAAPSPRADVYALGACLYELVTGRRPIQAETPADTLEAVILGDHVPLLELAPLLPARFVYVIERAIASKPAERFRSVEALGRALGRGASFEAGAHALMSLLDHLFGMLAAREIEAMVRMERHRPGDVLRESSLGGAAPR